MSSNPEASESDVAKNVSDKDEKSTKKSSTREKDSSSSRRERTSDKDSSSRRERTTGSSSRRDRTHGESSSRREKRSHHHSDSSSRRDRSHRSDQDRSSKSRDGVSSSNRSSGKSSRSRGDHHDKSPRSRKDKDSVSKSVDASDRTDPKPEASEHSASGRTIDASGRVSKLDASDRSAKNRAKPSSDTPMSPGAHHSKSETQKSREESDRAAKARVKRSMGGPPVVPGALSSTNTTEDRASHKARDEDQKAKDRARRSGKAPAAPGAHSSSSTAGDRTTRKQARDDADRAAKDRVKRSMGGAPGAVSSTVDSRGTERKKAGGKAGAVPGASAGQSGDRSRMEQKLRDAGLADNQESDAKNDNAAEPEVPDAYKIEAELVVDEEEKEEERGPAVAPILPQPPPNFASNTSPQENDDDKEPEPPKKTPWGKYAVLVLLVGGGALAALFAHRGGESSTVLIILPPEQNTTEFDFATPVPSANPTTSSPTAELLFDPPNAQDCLAISRNETIPGQEDMDQSALGIILDVELEASGEISDLQLLTLLASLQQVLIPSLVGCDISANRRNLMEKAPSAIRGAHRELVERWRYVIFNAFVRGKVLQGEVCQDGNSGRCHRIYVDLTLFLKGTVRNFYLVGLIPGQDGTNLVELLRLGNPFSVIKMIGVEILTPTQAPSVAPTATPSIGPTDSPSASPSNSPSMVPSISPTDKPSVAPAPGPTRVPSVGPSALPSIQPSDVPSSLPSGLPTQVPTPIPTPGPTLPPTRPPTPDPTPPPTRPPTPLPTRAPTPRPTADPLVWEFVGTKSGSPATISSLEFRGLVQASPNQIIRRYCSACISSHQYIYYKRLTNIPAESTYAFYSPSNFLDVFLNNWFSTPSNLLNTDFQLYGSYSDAVAGRNQWNYCNYNDVGVGFPRDCGISAFTPGQWSSTRVGTGLGWTFTVESVRWEIAIDYSGSSTFMITDSEFRFLLANSPNGIIRRQCDGCTATSHQNIFYKRITPLPTESEFNFYTPSSFIDLFANNWYSSPKNLLNRDFELYGSYQDALAGTNRWNWCNYNDATVGFPRDCGPTTNVNGQWFARGRAHRGSRFWVEASAL